MEFHFNIEKTIGKVVGDGIVFLDGAASKDYSQKDFENICLLLDQVGTLSATVIIIYNIHSLKDLNLLSQQE